MCHRLCRLLLPLVAWLCLSSANAAPGVPSGRVFYAPFDGSLDAAEARGDKRAEPEGKLSFAPGRAGQGLVVGDVDGPTGVSYAAAGNFSLERGTVALWVQPVNWRGDDKLNHVFFNAWPAEGGLFSLYKYASTAWGLTFYLDPGDGPRGKLYCTQPINAWKPGEWHHVACAWTHREGMALYLDGKPVKSLLGVSLPDKPLRPRVRFGSDWQRSGSRTVIDEAMIFERMLAPHEVALLAGQPAEAPDPEKPRDIPGVTLAHAILGQRVLARVYRDCLGAPVDAARLEVLPAGGGKPVATRTIPLADPLAALDLDAKPLPLGAYEARVTLLSGDTVRGIETLAFRKESDDTWENAARVGKEDTVLPGFAPLRVAAGPRVLLGTGDEGRGASSVGTRDGGRGTEPDAREYVFGGSGLPSGIRAGGHAMLAGPVRIVAAGAGGEVRFTPGAAKVEEQSPVQARVAGGLSADGLAVAAQALARYDGTVWTTLRFTPEKALRLERLRIEIPVPAAEAKYLAYIAMGRVDEKRLGYGALPAGEGAVWKREFLPSIWIGTEARGLGWYAESDEHWDIDGEEALTVERRGGEVALCMNVIRRPREVAKPFTIEFGLQATPVRALAPDWRSYQWVPATDITRFFLHLRKNPYPRADVEGQRPRGKVCYLYTYHDYFTNRPPKDPGEFLEMVERAKGYGLLGTPYTDTTYMPESEGDYWLREVELRSLPGARAATYGLMANASMCHKGPFGDWFVRYVAYLAHEYGANGIYLDDTWTYGCSNAAHGCGYVGPDGKRRPTYPLRARNETYRRLRAMFAATGKPFWITMHMSGGRVPPLPTFGDCLLLGEERYHDVAKNPDYCESITPEEWRASFATPSWGIPVVVIPQFKMNNDWMRDPEKAERLMAAVLPHDALVWPLFCDTETVMGYRKALEEFGVGEPDTRFLPYWEKLPGLACAHPAVKVSAYQRPGKLLLLLANWTGEEAKDTAVTLDPKLLNLPAALQAKDALTGEALPLAAGRLTLTVPAKRVRLIEVSGGG